MLYSYSFTLLLVQLIFVFTVDSNQTSCRQGVFHNVELPSQQANRFLYLNGACFTSRWPSHVVKHHLQHFTESYKASSFPNRTCGSLLFESVKSRRGWIVKSILEQNRIEHSEQLLSVQKLAYSLGNFQVLNQLLSRHNESSKLRDSNGNLMLASCKGRANTVAALLRNGAKVGRGYSRQNSSELLCAMSKNYSATASAILKFGNLSISYMNQKDKYGMSAFYRALIDSKRFLNVLAKLLQSGVDVNQRFSSGDSPLTLSVRQKASTRVIALLLSKNARINAVDNSPFRNTALHWACIYNLTDVVELLLKSGASVFAPNNIQNFPLSSALQYHTSVEILEMLLKHGASINERGESNATALVLAVRYTSSTKVVDFLLSQGADVNAVTIYKTTALQMAARFNLTQVASRLIAYGANINAADYNGDTALMYSSSSGSFEIAQELLRLGVNIYAKNNQGLNALAYASRQGFADIAELLLQHGADLNSPNNFGSSPLMLASQFNRLECIKLLLRHGADVNAVNQYGETALIPAVGWNSSSLELLDILLRNGVNVNAVSYESKTALQRAIQNGRSDIAKLLLRFGADFNSPMLGGLSHFQFVLFNNKSTDILKLLLDNGANVNEAENVSGFTPLIYACQRNNQAFVQLLLEKGANCNHQAANNNQTVLHFAATYSSAAIVALLVRWGAQVNAVNAFGFTPLMYTAQLTDQTSVISVLLLNGANINAIDRSGATALIYASWYNHTANVKVLLGAGANATVKTVSGQTALLFAVSNGSAEIVELLLKNGAQVEDRYKNDTVLMFAIDQNAGVETIQKLIDFGADVNATGPNGRSAISIARQSGRVEVIYLLKKEGATEENQDVIPAISILNQQTAFAQRYPFSVLKSGLRKVSRVRPMALLGLFTGFFDQQSPNDQHCLVEIVKSYLEALSDRSEIFTDYSLEVHYFDGEISEQFVPQLVDDFISWQSAYTINSKTIISPVFLGPQYRCSNLNYFDQSHRNVLRIVQRVNHLANVFSDPCSTRRDSIDTTAPRFQTGIVDSANETEAISMVALISFAKTANWKRISLISLVSEAGPTSLALLLRFHRQLIKDGIDINGLHIGESFSDIFTEIEKQPRVRILFVANNHLDCSLCIDLFCSSYQAGIQPDRYAILMIEPNCLKCSDDDNMAIGKKVEYGVNCSVSVQQAQKAMFFFGMPLASVGLKPPPFSAQVKKVGQNIQEYANTFFPTEQSCEADSWKPLKNSLLLTFYLLHATELKLQSKYAANLFELMADRTNQSASSLVELAVAEVAADADVENANGAYWSASRRTGVTVQANFDRNKMSSTSVKSEFEWRILSKILPKDWQARNFKFEFSEVSEQPVLWATKNGRAPKDLSAVTVLNRSYDEATFLSICVVAFILSCIQITLAVLARKKALKMTENFYFDEPNNRLIVVGCILLNVSAIILLIGVEYFPIQQCFFRPFCVVTSLTFINGSFFAKMWTMSSLTHENRYISRKFRKPNLFNGNFHEQQRMGKVASLQSKIRRTVALVLLVAVSLQCIWFSSDPMILKSSIAYENDPAFDSVSEMYYVIQIEWCESATQFYWVAFFVVCHALLLGISIVMGLALKRKLKFVRKRFKPDIIQLRTALSNSATIMVFTSFLMLVIPSRPASIFFVKTLAFAVCLLVFSAGTIVILFFPIWAPLLASSEIIISKLRQQSANLSAKVRPTVRRKDKWSLRRMAQTASSSDTTGKAISF